MRKELFILVGVYVTILHTDAKRRCLECNAVAQPLDCTTITDCGEHEICSMEKYVTNDGIVLFDVGCKDPHLCQANNRPLGRRHVRYNNSSEDPKRSTIIGTTICYQCCDNKDICNIDSHCGAERFTPPAGSRLCYTCDKATKPDDCNQMRLCDVDSLCSVKQVTNLLAETRWNLGCSLKEQCKALAQSSSSRFCSYCCGDQLCNMNCTVPPTTPPPPTTPTTTTTTPAPQIPPHVTAVQIQPPNPKYGENVQITCHATGSQPIKYEFMVRGAALALNSNVNQNVLTILNYNPQNDHAYRCAVSNVYGDHYKQFDLQGHA